MNDRIPPELLKRLPPDGLPPWTWTDDQRRADADFTHLIADRADDQTPR